MPAQKGVATPFQCIGTPSDESHPQHNPCNELGLASPGGVTCSTGMQGCVRVEVERRLLMHDVPPLMILFLGLLPLGGAVEYDVTVHQIDDAGQAKVSKETFVLDTRWGTINTLKTMFTGADALTQDLKAVGDHVRRKYALGR